MGGGGEIRFADCQAGHVDALRFELEGLGVDGQSGGRLYVGILSENCMGLYLGGYMTLSSCSSRLGPVCKLVDMREVERAFFL